MTQGTFNTLLAIVREHPFQEPKPIRVLAELALFIGMTLSGVAVFLASPNLLVKIAAMFFSTCGCLGMATLAHTASHYTALRSRRLNQFLTYFGYAFFFGVSATYWYNKHCVVHHPTPNLVGKDDDIDLSPYFAITEDQFKKGPMRFLHAVQWILIPLALALNEFNIQRSGWIYLLKKLRDPRERRTGHWVDLAVILSHWVTWLFLPMLFLGPGGAVGLYVLRMALMGYAMFIAFAPAHFPEEAVAAEPNQTSADFMLRQTATTVNFRTGPFGRLLCGGVEYQIEHHLFPWIPPYYYPELSKIVGDFCRKHGYPYKTLGWWEGTWKSLVVFYRPKRVLPRLDVCMETADAAATTTQPAFAPHGGIAPFVVSAGEVKSATARRH